MLNLAMYTLLGFLAILPFLAEALLRRYTKVFPKIFQAIALAAIFIMILGCTYSLAYAILPGNSFSSEDPRGSLVTQSTQLLLLTGLFVSLALSHSNRILNPAKLGSYPTLIGTAFVSILSIVAISTLFDSVLVNGPWQEPTSQPSILYREEGFDASTRYEKLFIAVSSTMSTAIFSIFLIRRRLQEAFSAKQYRSPLYALIGLSILIASLIHVIPDAGKLFEIWASQLPLLIGSSAVYANQIILLASVDWNARFNAHNP